MNKWKHKKGTKYGQTHTPYGKFYSWLIRFEIYNKIWRWFDESNQDFHLAKTGRKEIDYYGNIYYSPTKPYESG